MMENKCSLYASIARGIRRGSLFLLSFGIALLFLTATGARAQTAVGPVTLTVTTLGDSTGTCDLTASPNPTCPTLRAAIDDANASGVNGDTINFKSGPNLTEDLTGTITLGSALPTVNVGLIIQGPGANLLAISGAGKYQILYVQHGAASISGLTFANGNSDQAGNQGGAILYTAPVGALAITDCTFSGNRSYSGAGYGGAIADNSTSGKLTITNSTFADNIALGGGGAVSDSSNGNLTVINSTFVDNGHSPKPGYNAVAIGGAIAMEPNISSGTTLVTVVDSTFADNSASTAGGAIATGLTTVYAANNIFSGNSASLGGGIDLGLSTTLSGEDYNLFYKNSDNIYDRTTNSDLTLGTNDVSGTKADPKLLPLGRYGGPIETMMPEVGSPAIGVGAYSSELPSGLPSGVTEPSNDQRGFPLFNAAGPVDIGAVQTNYLVVTSTSGGSAGADCTSGQTGSTCSLSDAITAANSSATGYTDIGFSTSLGGGNYFQTNLSSPLSLSSGNTVIVGPPDVVHILGGSTTQLFSMGQYSTANLTLYGLTLANGHKYSGSGGAIGHDGYGTVTISNCYLTGNFSNNGGAIEVSENGALNVIDSTFYQNSSLSVGGDGGAIYISDGRVTVTNSTFDNNYLAQGDGGAIYNASSSLTLTDDTFAYNRADLSSSGGEGGAIYNDSDRPVTVTNSIFASNTAASEGGIYNSFGTFTTGYDLFYDNTGGNSNATNFPATGDIQEPSSSPSPIAVATNVPAPNGGPTNTLLTLPGPAICHGLLADVPGGTLTDQRGFPRTTTYTVNSNPLTCVDIGALQTHYTRIRFVSPPTNGYTETSGKVVDTAPVVSVIESGQNIGNVPVTLTLSGGTTPTSVTGNTASTVAGTGATFSNLTVTVSPTTTYTLSSTLNLFTPPGSTTPVSITTNANPSLTVTSPTVGTSTQLQIAPPSTTYGDTVTFTATVSPDSGSTAPTGSVQFTLVNNSTKATTTAVEATGACANGISTDSCASYSNSKLDAGTYTVSAIFTPSTSAFSGSDVTASQGLTIGKATPKITFGPTPTPTYLGGNFTVGASTTNTDSSALTFSATGPCSLVSAPTANPATLSSSGAGTCAVTAQSVATTNFNSVSNTLDVTIAKATPKVSISNIPANPLVGQSFTPDVVVSPTSDHGTITVTLTASDTGICTLGASGVVNFVGPTTSGGTGTCTLDVSVTGSTDFNAVSDQPVSFTVESDQFAIGTIANAVQNLNLKNGQKNSLLKELDQASTMISEGKISGAINNLNQFIAEVQDLASSGKLSQTLAERLIYDTNVIITALESQL